MVVDYLIVGQGICGTMLSWFLHKEGKTFLVIDDKKENAATRIAAGVINPVTGRRYAYSWMIDEIMPFAIQTYDEMGNYFNSRLIFKKSIIDFFPTAQMRNAFVERLTDNDTYLHSYPEQNNFNPCFNYDFGCGEVSPAYLVHLEILLAAWRNKLTELKAIEKESFEMEALKTGSE
ncbi:MAG TPA: FAD-dependent oxidoreductase, partial [Flavisolibacter sp.]|nr:FAD-dependent oxidoreductase [Flavisolibacter sp.]